MSKEDEIRKIVERIAGEIPGASLESVEVRQIGGPMDEESTATLSPSIQARRLLDHFSDYLKQHSFEPGNLIQFKQGMNALKYPKKGQPAIVLEVFDEPFHLRPKENQRYTPCDEFLFSRHCGEIRDIRIGIIGDDKEFVMYVVDSRMFEPYTGDVYDFGMMGNA